MRGNEIADLRKRAEVELREDILPFWIRHSADPDNGGFWGQISNDLTIEPGADKGLILNSRILWTFSRAFRRFGDDRMLAMAERAHETVLNWFWDQEHGGANCLVDYQRRPIDTKKSVYGQAFTVYALAEFFDATGRRESLEQARQLLWLIESKASDQVCGGYYEVYERDWSLAEEQRLSPVDMDEKKSMNTHLHLLEAYANLLRVDREAKLEEKLRKLISVFLTRIVDPRTYHFRLFFDEQWQSRSERISFGHDIEGSWLLCEACEILGDQDLLAHVRNVAMEMALAVRGSGIDRDGGLLYEASPDGITDDDKHWWPQAEAVVGFLNAYELSGQEDFLSAALRSWAFIENFIIDRDYGEWFWKVSRAGVPSDNRFKVDPWKGPYHNARACMEIMERLDRLTASSQQGESS